MPATHPTKAIFVEIDDQQAGQRLDNFLLRQLKGVPRALVYRIIRKGEVRINKGRAKQTTRLKAGDIVRIPPVRQNNRAAPAVNTDRFEFLKRAVIFEDESLLVINKPSGMAVHAGSGIRTGIIEAMRLLRPELRYLELVHRLDRETSGCLVLAKRSSALRSLNEDFASNSLKNKRVDKTYLALVKGRWQHGQRRVTKALNTDARKHGERHVIVDESGSYASSVMTPVQAGDVASLIEVKLLTGRTHQVRVHALSENHPLAGDQRYGDPDFNKSMKKKGLSRLFLHAAKLVIVHPQTNEKLELNAPIPEELAAVLENLALENEI